MNEPMAVEPWGKTIESIIDLLSNTSSLTQLTLSSLTLGESFFKKLLERLQKHKSSSATTPKEEASDLSPRIDPSSAVGLSEIKLTHISLAGTRLDVKSWELLGEILKVISNSITSLNLSKCGITRDVIANLSEALIFSTGNNLQHLDLSCNELGQAGTSALNHVISSGHCLHELNLSNCAVDFAEICKYVKKKGCGVQRLVLSHNPISESHAEELVSLGLFSTTLRSLDISYTGITASKAAKLLNALLHNHDLPESIDLNLSGNPALGQEMSAIASQLVERGVNKMGALFLDDCNLQDKGLQALFKTLTTASLDHLSFTSLSVSYNLNDTSNVKQRKETAASINAFLAKYGNSLQEFIIRGGCPPGRDNAEDTNFSDPQLLKFGPALAKALVCLADQESGSGGGGGGLKLLDIQGNECGKKIVQVLIGVVKAHRTIEQIRCDNNRIPLSCYEELLEEAQRSKTLTSLSAPLIDCQLEKDEKEAKLVIGLIEKFNKSQKTTGGGGEKAEGASGKGKEKTME